MRVSAAPAPGVEKRATFATGLRCLRCAAVYSFDATASVCQACGKGTGTSDPGVLDVLYDYDGARAHLPLAGDGARDVFSYAALLPVQRPPTPQLPAGGTALVAAPRLARWYGLAELWLKDETRNPTRCLKDRATAIAVAMAAERGAKALYCASAGNAAISLAGFCAHAQLACHVYVPSGIAAQRLAWLRAFGAQVRVSDGNYDVAFEEAERDAARHGWYSRNCALNPFLVEGKKTVALEMAELIGAPDYVVAPVGDGCTLGAIGKGFREAREAGWIDVLPRLVGVQSDDIRPIVDRFAGVAAPAAPDGAWRPPLASSIAVRRPRNALRLLAELRASGGTMIPVSDTQLVDAQRRLSEEGGVVAEHTSAATLAALDQLAASASLEGRRAVLVITGGRVDP